MSGRPVYSEQTAMESVFSRYPGLTVDSSGNTELPVQGGQSVLSGQREQSRDQVQYDEVIPSRDYYSFSDPHQTPFDPSHEEATPSLLARFDQLKNDWDQYAQAIANYVNSWTRSNTHSLKEQLEARLNLWEDKLEDLERRHEAGRQRRVAQGTEIVSNRSELLDWIGKVQGVLETQLRALESRISGLEKKSSMCTCHSSQIGATEGDA